MQTIVLEIRYHQWCCMRSSPLRWSSVDAMHDRTSGDSAMFAQILFALEREARLDASRVLQVSDLTQKQSLIRMVYARSQ